MISITGIYGEAGDRCGVDFKLGTGDDIGLHFNPRPKESLVVRNTFLEGGWGEREMDGGFPFQPGQPFIVSILTEPQMYKISVNGKNFAEYKHRVPFEQVKSVGIWGDVAIKSISYH